MNENTNTQTNSSREYKSSVFVDYFTSDKRKLIELYNAVLAQDFPEDTPIEINTLEGVLVKDRYNDISFLLGDKLVVFIEHESSINPNMPIRLLEYLTAVYKKIIAESDSRRLRFRRTPVKLPKPEFIVLYNGTNDYPDQNTLRLSDLFCDAETKELLELTVTVYNINEGRNPELVERSRALLEYVRFIAKAREFEKSGIPRSKALKDAVEYCMENDIMKDYFAEHAHEFGSMLYTEWDWDEMLEVARDVAREEGLAEGLAEGEARGEAVKQRDIARRMKAGGMEVALIMRMTGLGSADIEAL